MLSVTSAQSFKTIVYLQLLVQEVMFYARENRKHGGFRCRKRVRTLVSIMISEDNRVVWSDNMLKHFTLEQMPDSF